MESLLPILIPATFAAFMALIIWAAVVQTRKARENLQALADRLGFTIQEPPKKGWFASSDRRLTGTFRGRSAQIYTFTTGSGKNRSTWCALSLRVATPPGFSLKVTGENLFTKAGRIFGVEDVTTGDPSFDDRFFVKSSQPAYVRAALIPEVRIRLLETWQKHRAFGAFVVESGEAKYTELGTFGNAKLCDRFPAMLEIAADLAEIAEAYRA